MSVSEKELNDVAVAPRVTDNDVEAEISGEYYFRAVDGVIGGRIANNVSLTLEINHSEQLGLLTFCVLVLRNGFTVMGQSACASPANYNQGIGERLARVDAKNKIWNLMGFMLRDRIAMEERRQAFAAVETHTDRMESEAGELQTKLSKLERFIKESPIFRDAPLRTKTLMEEQAMVMNHYLLILKNRLS